MAESLLDMLLGEPSRLTTRYPEMAWWVDRAKANGELKRLPGETKTAYEKRVRASWNTFADKYDLSRSSGKPKHRAGNLGRVESKEMMPKWLKDREAQIKGNPIKRGRTPLGVPKGLRDGPGGFQANRGGKITRVKRIGRSIRRGAARIGTGVGKAVMGGF